MEKHKVPQWVTGKIKKYCAFNERCVFDIREKLREWEIQEHFYEDIIRLLLHENYVNEERYARVFAGGKFRNNKWGKNKIMNALQRKNIPELYIQMGLREIDENEYMETLKRLIAIKKEEIREKDTLRAKYKIISYAIGKGYEPDLVKEIVKM